MEIYFDSFVIFVGIIAIAYPVYNAITFIKTNELGFAVALMFLGEGLAMAITTIFAILALLHLLDDTPYWLQGSMRLVMLFTAIWTSRKLHLAARAVLGKK